MALLLTREDVISVLTMNECIDVVEKAFLELHNGTAVLPLRIGITPPDGLALYMPAYLKGLNALACKVVTVYKDNPSKQDLPVTIGKVLLQNPESGEVISIMDGGYLTAVRTGAVSGVATKYMAQDKKNMVAGIFGAGVQAQMQLEAMTVVRDIQKAIVFDKFETAANQFCETMSKKLGIEVAYAANPTEVLQADIICTATSSPTPIFDGAEVAPGTHINGIGSHTPNARELDETIVKRSVFVGDAKDACLKEAGDIMIPLTDGAITEDHYFGDLGEVIAGIKIPRNSADDITIFKSNGLAIQDVAAAKLTYDRATAQGIGMEIQL